MAHDIGDQNMKIIRDSTIILPSQIQLNDESSIDLKGKQRSPATSFIDYGDATSPLTPNLCKEKFDNNKTMQIDETPADTREDTTSTSKREVHKKMITKKTKLWNSIRKTAQPPCSSKELCNTEDSEPKRLLLSKKREMYRLAGDTFTITNKNTYASPILKSDGEPDSAGKLNKQMKEEDNVDRQKFDHGKAGHLKTMQSDFLKSVVSIHGNDLKSQVINRHRLDQNRINKSLYGSNIEIKLQNLFFGRGKIH